MTSTGDTDNVHVQLAMQRIGEELEQCSRLMREESAKEHPDQDLLDRYRQTQRRLTAERDSLGLRPDDKVEDLSRRYRASPLLDDSGSPF